MTVLADAEKRGRVLDPGKSFHLEAPAGSGKTFLLAARFLKLLGLVAHPQQILALTFTKKAAGEMRQRVRGYLARARAKDAPGSGADAELLAFAQSALDAHPNLDELLLAGEILRIQTFHSFCHAVAAQAPLEAGIPPGAVLMDDGEQEFFLGETVDEALRDIAARGPEDPARRALQDRLLYLNNSWYHLAGEMKELVRRREGLGDLVRVLNLDRATDYLFGRIRELVEVSIEAARREFDSCALGKRWSEFVECLARAGGSAAETLPGQVPPSEWECLPQWVRLAGTLLTTGGTVRKQPGPKAGFYSGFSKSEWGAVLQAVPPETAEKLHALCSLPSFDAPLRDVKTLWDLILLFHAVFAFYSEKCRAGRLLDFSELEMAALRLFDAAEPSDLQLILDQQVRHILVDEFQDTSRGQWELLRKLCSGWSESDGRTLFLVGDPKQSIYGFRKAEVQLFLEAAHGLPLGAGEKLPVEAVVLDTNFRSQPHLISWCNSLFGTTVMAEYKSEYDEVPFSPAVVSPTTPLHSTETPPELALFLDWPDRESARRREADWLAGRVQRHIEQNGPGSEAGILLFARTHLSVYLEALQQRMIPVRVQEGLKLVERPDVRYLWLLCRAIVMPQDDLAWAAQLRSPWLFLDFDRILDLSREEGDLWVEKVRTFAEKDPDVGRFWKSLATAWQHLGHEPLARVVETAWLDLDGARIAGSRWGSRGISCCRQFLEIVRKAEEGEPVKTLQRLEQLIDKAYEPVDPDTASSNVTVLTVHGAKGLEFDAVFVPFLDWDPLATRHKLPPPYMLERSPGSGDYLLGTRPDRLTGGEDALYKLLRDLRSRRQLGESKRLFYVAATRARRELVMSAVMRKKGNGFAARGDTPLGWLDSHYVLDELAELGETGPPDAGEGPGGEILAAWRKERRSKDGAFSVLVEPASFPGASAPARERRPVAVEPAAFEREKSRFTVISPSSLNRPSAAAAGAPSPHASLPCSPDFWGTLVHRLLAEFGKTNALPGADRVISHVLRGGAGEWEAGTVAGEALREVEACLADPWLQAFYAVPPGCRRVEWAVECARGENTLLSGVIDLAAKIGGRWKLVDFKTARPRPDEALADFERREMDLYRLQIEAYREMWAKLMETEEENGEVFLYWTALRRAKRY